MLVVRLYVIEPIIQGHLVEIKSQGSSLFLTSSHE